MAALKTLKYDFRGTVKVHSVIPGLTGANSAFSALMPTDLNEKFDGTGAAVLPDRSSVDTHQSLGDTTTRVRSITIGDTEYFTNPTTGAWLKTTVKGLGIGMSGASSMGQFDLSSTNQLLKYAKSVTDLGDTQVNGVRVHHYRLFVDTDKLKAALPSSGNSTMVPGLATGLTIKTYQFENWVGIDDHLLRQTQLDYAMSLVAPTPVAKPPGCVTVKTLQTPPAGATACPQDFSGMTYDASASMTVKLHDFNSKVTIEAPPNAQDMGSLGSMFGSSSSSSSGALGVPTPTATR